MREDWYEALEAVLMISAEPLTADDLAQGLGIDKDSVEKALADLAADYDGCLLYTSDAADDTASV